MSTADRNVYVHPNALVETSIERLGEGSRVWAFAHVMKDVTIGRDCNIGDHAFVESGVVLGNAVTVKNGVAIWAHVHIADNVFLGPNAVLTNDRFPRSRDPHWKSEPTWIEEGVTVGANATIVCGVRLGQRSMIAAGAVVTRDVPPYALVLGSPARRRGWVCHCGQPLPAADAQGNLRCTACARAFRPAGEDPARGLEGAD